MLSIQRQQSSFLVHISRSARPPLSTSLTLATSGFYPTKSMANMKFILFGILALNVASTAISAAQVSWSCAGSTLCRGLAQSDCDAARRQIQSGNRYFTGGNKGNTGVCSGHCGLFVSGSNCDLTGQEMIVAFDELRSRNCQKCGIKTYDDGCQFKADYVTGC